MKKLFPSSDKNATKNKPIKNLSKILNSDLFFQSSGVIKMALNKNRLIDKDFGVKRAKAKIDVGKKPKIIFNSKIKHNSKKSKEEENENNNINTFFQKREVPFELADIIENNKTIFEKVFDSFYKLKSKNDEFASHWHYVQKSIEKLKIQKYQKTDEIYDKKNDEFSKNLKKYDFSARDKMELELEKKITEKIFKSNPLMIKSNNDMLFYYLYEYKNKFINFKEQNPTKYLNKMKELLDFEELFVDFKKNKMDKDIEAQNVNFMMKRQRKIDEENIKLKEEQKKQNIKDNKESKRMIRQTKKSIKLLNKNKNYFEDKNYFSNNNNISSTFYKNSSINKSKFLTPNKSSLKMSKSSSNFFNGDNNKFNQFKFNSALRFLQQKKFNLSQKLSSLMNNDTNDKTGKNDNRKLDKRDKKKYSFQENINNSKLGSLFKNYIESNSKDSSLINRNINSQKLNNLKIIHKSNSLNNNNYTIHNKLNQDDYKILPTIKKFPYEQPLSGERKAIYPPKSNFSNVYSQKEKENSSNLPTSKNNNDSSQPSLLKSLVNESLNDNKKEKDKRKSRNSNLIDNNLQKVVVSELYDKLKDGKILNANNMKNIYKFIHHKKISKKKKKDTMNLIKDVQLLSDGFDINKVSKSIEDLPNKEIKQIKNFKIINNELNKLDKKYAREICEFKARNQRNEGFEDFI